MKINKQTLKKAFKDTSSFIILLVMILAIYVGINIGIESLNINDVDFTKDKLYTLSESSKNILNNISQEVEITLVNLEIAEDIMDFAKLYEKESDFITINYINDITKDPLLTSQYNLTVDTYAVIVNSGDREKYVDANDFYYYDYLTGDETLLTEEVLTNAILDVIIEVKPKIYFLAGQSISSEVTFNTFKETLTNEANEIEDLDILAVESVPEDCTVLVITTLTQDILEVEANAIIDYINKGGKIALFSDANILGIDTPNFQKVLDIYGFSISEGVLLEQDTSRMLMNSPYGMIVSPSQYTQITKELNLTACLFIPGVINSLDYYELEELDVSMTSLISTYGTTFYRTDLTIETPYKTEDEEDVYATVGALFEKQIEEDVKSSIIVFSEGTFMSDNYVMLGNSYVNCIDLYNNKDVALNTISYLSGRDDTITLRKEIERTTYTVTETQKQIVLTVIFTIPCIIIFAGVVVWVVRRRKK